MSLSHYFGKVVGSSQSTVLDLARNVSSGKRFDLSGLQFVDSLALERQTLPEVLGLKTGEFFLSSEVSSSTDRLGGSQLAISSL